MPLCFRLGEFVSSVQQKGFYHKDMQICNIGFGKDGRFKFVDFADVEQFLYPYEIDIDKMSRCLLPLLRERSFKEIAMFRLGYICSGGEISENVFRNLYKKELSSLDFWYGNEKIKYDNVNSSIDFKVAKEWKESCVAEKLFSQYCELEKFEQMEIRKNISEKNKYFLDTYYLIVYFYFFMDKKEYNQLAIILANIGFKEYFKGHMAAAYIYFKLCFEIIEIHKITSKHLVSIVEEKLIECKRKTIYKASSLSKIKKQIIQEKYDLAQIHWIVYDLENIILKQECKKYTQVNVLTR